MTFAWEKFNEIIYNVNKEERVSQDGKDNTLAKRPKNSSFKVLTVKV